MPEDQMKETMGWYTLLLCNIFMVDTTILDRNRAPNVVCCGNLGVAPPKYTIIMAFKTTSGTLLCQKPNFFTVFFYLFIFFNVFVKSSLL